MMMLNCTGLIRVNVQIQLLMLQVVSTIIYMFVCICCLRSRAQQLAEEENLSKGTFFERCMHDPSIRDRLPILTRSLDLNRKV